MFTDLLCDLKPTLLGHLLTCVVQMFFELGDDLREDELCGLKSF